MGLPSTFITAAVCFLAFPVRGNNSFALTKFVRCGSQTSPSPSLNLPSKPVFSIGESSSLVSRKMRPSEKMIVAITIWHMS